MASSHGARRVYPDRAVVVNEVLIRHRPADFFFLRVCQEFLEKARLITVGRLVLGVASIWLDEALGIPLKLLGKVLFGKLVHRLTQVFPFRLRFFVALAAGGSKQKLFVSPQNHRVYEKSAGGDELFVGNVLGLLGVKRKARPDQEQSGRSEEEAAFPLQARFTQQTFERSIGHLVPPTSIHRPARRARARSIFHDALGLAANTKVSG